MRRRLPISASCVSVALVAAVVLSGCRGRAGNEAGPPPPPPEPEVSAAPEAEVASLSEVAAQYEQLEQQQTQTNKRIADLLARYQRRGGSLPPGFGPDLTDEQRALLAERIKTERAGLRALLQDIIDRDKEVAELKARSQEIRGRLPEHVTAKEGDRHDRIAMDFLIKQGVSADKAYQIVSQVNLQDALVPGFRVWTYYQNGQFGTWVTKGTAGITPHEHQRRLTEMLQSERDEARSALGRTREDLEDTRNIAKRTEEALERTAEDLDAMTRAAERQREENAQREAAENTVRYVIGSKAQLVARKVIDKNMRLRALDSPEARAINLVDSSEIAIDASVYGLRRIKKITLVPEVFANGVDYQGTQDGPFATIRITRPDKFKNARFFVIVLE